MRKYAFLKYMYKPDITIKGQKIRCLQEIYDRQFSLESIKDTEGKHTGKYRLLADNRPTDIITSGRYVLDCILIHDHVFVFVESHRKCGMQIYLLDKKNKFVDHKVIYGGYFPFLESHSEFDRKNRLSLSLVVVDIFQHLIFRKELFGFYHILTYKKSRFFGLQRKAKIGSLFKLKVKKQELLSYIQVVLHPKTKQNVKTVIEAIQEDNHISIHFINLIDAPEYIHMPPYYAREFSHHILSQNLRVFDIGGMSFVFKDNGELVTINLLTVFLDQCKEEVFSVDFSAYPLVDLYFYELLKPHKKWLREENNPVVTFNVGQKILKYRFKTHTKQTKTYALSNNILVSVDEHSCLVDLMIKDVPLKVGAVS